MISLIILSITILHGIISVGGCVSLSSRSNFDSYKLVRSGSEFTLLLHNFFFFFENSHLPHNSARCVILFLPKLPKLNFFKKNFDFFVPTVSPTFSWKLLNFVRGKLPVSLIRSKSLKIPEIIQLDHKLLQNMIDVDTFFCCHSTKVIYSKVFSTRMITISCIEATYHCHCQKFQWIYLKCKHFRFTIHSDWRKKKEKSFKKPHQSHFKLQWKNELKFKARKHTVLHAFNKLSSSLQKSP